MGFIEKLVNPVGSTVKGAMQQQMKSQAQIAEENRVQGIRNRNLAAQTRDQAAGLGGRFSGLMSSEVVDPITGDPVLRQFKSNIDQNTGLLQGPYTIQAHVDGRALDQLRSEALRTPGEMSKWGQLALTQSRDQAAAQAMGQSAQARNQLAAQGGLRSGARERLAGQSMQSQLAAGQQALRGIQTQDEQNRMQLLQQMPGQELAWNKAHWDVQSQNIERALGEMDKERAAETARYAGEMQKWAGLKSSEALKSQAEQAKATSGLFGGGGFLGLGCFLTTACVDAMEMSDDCWVLTEARRFRDSFMCKTPETALEIVEYYEQAPVIVSKINEFEDSKKIWKSIFWKGIIPFVNEVKNNNFEKAHALYKDLIKHTKQIAENN